MGHLMHPTGPRHARRICVALATLAALLLPAPAQAERDEVANWPATCAEAVARLTFELPAEERRRLAAMPEQNLPLLHHGYGTHIRNSFGLWLGNIALARDCTGAALPHPDEASMAIIRALWLSLQP
ncbi:hypothetical protein FHY55_09020 [Oceanicola sp. D3]|uniref:DUF6794 domain-containing protein n=1 Tax=Oceanicola sp. D3 TaxID=2587163 RepID=UPI00111EDB92|nr:DUF6794 domain-containing protein [Oceanicola sp. D3]QDC09377.1 hypothetical protein FHY55_09020 [Oceanicola sp. D3]